MATELYHNPDGTVGGLDGGKVMVAPTQEEFEACCCCPCFGEQPNAGVVFGGGGCGDPNGWCAGSDGDYVFDKSEKGEWGIYECRYSWTKGDYLVRAYGTRAEGIGNVIVGRTALPYSYENPLALYGLYDAEGGLLSCVDGIWTETKVLSGWHNDCSVPTSCTVTVSFGGV